MSKYPLTNFGLMAKKHWKIYLPKTYKRLEESGQLEELLYHLQERAKRQLGDLMQKGLAYDQAWEIVREDLLPPAEPDYQKHLNLDEWPEDEII